MKEVFNAFREYCTPIMVEAANFSFLDIRRRKETPLIKTFPREPNSHSSESLRAAKRAGSLQSGIPPSISVDLPIFDCDNCGGTHKSMNCSKRICKLCKSRGENADHVQYLCPLIPNPKERKQSQQPRGVAPSLSLPRSVKSATKKTAGSIISAITQDDEYHTEEDSEVSDYPVYIDTCASDIYTPLASNLDADSPHVHTRVMDRLKVEQADGTN